MINHVLLRTEGKDMGREQRETCGSRTCEENGEETTVV